MATQNAINRTSDALFATVFDTNVAAAGVTLFGNTLSADGTDAAIPINIIPKGVASVIIDGLKYPQADGGAGEVLVTDGATNLSFAILTVPGGGSGLETITDHAVMVGAGVGAVTPIGMDTNGMLLIGSNGADPTAAVLTSTGGTVTITNGAGSINLEASGGFNIVETTGDAVAGAINTMYIVKNATPANNTVITLPDTAPQGSSIQIAGYTTGGFTIAQNAGETVFFGNQTTTPGVGGSIASTADHDTIEIICVTADTEWQIADAVGNFTIV